MVGASLVREKQPIAGLSRPAGDQPFPGGLVVRIRRSHRRGPGSIPGQGTLFCPPTADCEVELACLFEKASPSKTKGLSTGGCGDIISAYQLSAARLLAQITASDAGRRAGRSKREAKRSPPSIRESKPGPLGENQESDR
ncbi:hypothetical protein QQF64_003183 [Cirrhinus molitorella]|uniref:Uncharacterized protein n=1 Tax=Cirrhinus molitorella TaxID=172907 RepID=A0ABR3MKH9_9TELE